MKGGQKKKRKKMERKGWVDGNNRKHEPCFQKARDCPFLSAFPRVFSRVRYSESRGLKIPSSSSTMFLVYGQISPGSWPAALAGRAPSAKAAAAKAGQVKVPRGDGHTLRAEDAANSSGGGASHNCVLSLSVLSIRPCTISDSLQFTSCL